MIGGAASSLHLSPAWVVWFVWPRRRRGAHDYEQMPYQGAEGSGERSPRILAPPTRRVRSS